MNECVVLLNQLKEMHESLVTSIMVANSFGQHSVTPLLISQSFDKCARKNKETSIFGSKMILKYQTTV